MTEVESPRQLRLSTTIRGIVLALLLAAYNYFAKQPGASLSLMLLIAAATQAIVLFIRKVVPPDRQPQALYIWEMFADGATVLLFALGIYGGIFRMANAV
jgi:hypothetical protein